MTPAELLAFLKRHRIAIVASVDANAAPEAAVVGIAISDRFEIVFDTLTTTRKAINWRRNARAAAVIGDEEVTVQIDGVADEPRGDELAGFKHLYFAAYPDGPEREKWPDITYFRIRPDWIRCSDCRPQSSGIKEWTAADLLRSD